MAERVTREEYGASFTAQDETKKAVKSADRGIKQLVKTYALLGTGAVAAFEAVKGGVLFLNEATTAAGQQDAAERTLQQALKNAGVVYADYRDQLLGAATDLQKLTGADDDQTIASMGLGVALGVPVDKLGDYSIALANAQAAGLPLETMTRGLSASFGGSATALSRYIPSIRELTEEQLKAGGALDMINEKFGGLAEAQSTTWLGAVNRLKGAYGDFAEEGVGNIIAQSTAARAAMIVLSNVMIDAAGSIVEQQDEMTESVDGFVFGIIDAAEQVAIAGIRIEQVVVGLKIVFKSLNVTAQSAFNGIQEVAFTTSEILARVTEMLQPEKFKGFTDAVSAQADMLRKENKATSEAMRAELAQDVAAWVGIEGQIDAIHTAFDGYRGSVRDTMGALAELDNLNTDVAGGLGDIADEAEDAASALDKTSAAAKILAGEMNLDALAATRQALQQSTVAYEDHNEAIDAVNLLIREQSDALAQLRGEQVLVANGTAFVFEEQEKAAEAWEQQVRTAQDAFLDYAQTVDTVGAVIVDQTLPMIDQGFRSVFQSVAKSIDMAIQANKDLEQSEKDMLAGITNVLISLVGEVIAAATSQAIANAIAAASGAAAQAPNWMAGLAEFGVVAGTLLTAIGIGIEAAKASDVGSAAAGTSSVGAAEGGFVVGPGQRGIDSVPILAAPGEVILPADVVDAVRSTLTSPVIGLQGSTPAVNVPGTVGGEAAQGQLLAAQGGARGDVNVTFREESWFPSDRVSFDRKVNRGMGSTIRRLQGMRQI